VVVGVGPGLGAALARRFAQGGHAVALVARTAAALEPVAAEIGSTGGRALVVTADAASAADARTACARVRAELGPIGVLVYNAGAFQLGGVLELTPERLEECFRIGCLGALVWSQEVVPGMLERKRGTILLTGATASLRGSARFAALAVPKFGLRALGQSMARELGPQGVHVAHVVVDGMIDTPRVRQMVGARDSGSMLDPAAIAETYWHLAEQPATVWTQELDVRPAVEKF